MTCKDCIHYVICKDVGCARYDNFDDKTKYTTCTTFKDKSKYIELPCKIGDILYEPYEDDIDESRVTSICIKADEIEIEADSGIFIANSFDKNDIGKTVFLTKEEAQKALQGGV